MFTINRRAPDLLNFVSETVFKKVSQKETFSTNQIAGNSKVFSLLSENEQKNMLRAKINAQTTVEQRLGIQLIQSLSMIVLQVC